jgi:hypothetical protein
MPPVRYAPGTKSQRSPSEYTDAQYAALEGVKQTVPRLKLGAARPEFANKVMLADGSISEDLEAVRVAAAKQDPREAGNIQELDAHIAQNRFLFIVDVDLVPRIYFQCATPGNPDVELAAESTGETQVIGAGDVGTLTL